MKQLLQYWGAKLAVVVLNLVSGVAHVASTAKLAVVMIAE